MRFRNTEGSQPARIVVDRDAIAHNAHIKRLEMPMIRIMTKNGDQHCNGIELLGPSGEVLGCLKWSDSTFRDSGSHIWLEYPAHLVQVINDAQSP